MISTRVFIIVLLLLVEYTECKGSTYVHPLISWWRKETPKKEETKEIIRIGITKQNLIRGKHCTKPWSEFIGSHSRLLYLVASHLGQAKNCVPVDNVVSSYNEVAQGNIEISMEPAYQKVINHMNVSFLYPHDIENVCILVRKPPPIHSSVLLSVTYPIWIALALFYIFFFIITLINYENDVGVAFFEVNRTLFTGTFDRKLRYFMFWLSILCFFVGNTIAGSFTGYIVSPSTERNIDTLEEFASKAKSLYASEYQRFNIENIAKEGGVYASIEAKVEYRAMAQITKVLPVLTGMTGNAKLLSSAPQHEGAYINGVLQYHLVKECLIDTAYLSFVTRKNWLEEDIGKIFSRWIQHLVEVGIASYLREVHWNWWLTDFITAHRLQRKPGTSMLKEPTSVEALGLLHLREAFVLWMVGVSGASICFVVERYICWRESKNIFLNVN